MEVGVRVVYTKDGKTHRGMVCMPSDVLAERDLYDQTCPSTHIAVRLDELIDSSPYYYWYLRQERVTAAQTVRVEGNELILEEL